MADVGGSSRGDIIGAVKTPLGFLVLGILIVEGAVAVMAAALPDFRTELVWTFIIGFAALVIIVVGLAAWRPEALQGGRPLERESAERLAQDLFIGLDGSLRNLPPAERGEAWLLAAVSIAQPSATNADGRFRNAMSEKLTALAKIMARQAAPRGAVPDAPPPAPDD